MPYCAILECKNDSRTINVSKGGISYHRFPKAPEIKEKWIEVTGRQSWFPAKSSTICSGHFIEQDFLIKSGKKYLANTAVPKQKIIYFQSDAQNFAKRDESINMGSGPSTETSMLTMQRKLKHDDEAFTIFPSHKLKSMDTNPVIPSSLASTPREKKLQGVLRWKESKIKKQNLIIKKLKAKNRRLKKKINKIEDILKTLVEKFSMVNENITNNETLM